jgi:hypothetical protein
MAAPSTFIQATAALVAGADVQARDDQARRVLGDR